jgi:hypothetical protein
MRAFIYIFSLAMVCFFGCGCDSQNAATVGARFGGATNVSLVASPKTVTAWRTVGSFQPSESYQDSLKHFTKSGTGILVPPDLVIQFTNILLNERSYISRSVVDQCIHEPDLVLTFSDGTRDLDLFFCMDCQIMLVKIGDGEKGQPPNTVDSDFTRIAAPKLTHIIKQIFQKDDAIQRLKDD